MEGAPAHDLLGRAFKEACAAPFLKQAWEKASVGEFEAAEGFLWRAAIFFHGARATTDDDPPYIREAANQQACVPGGCGYVMTGASLVNPRVSTDAAVIGWVTALEQARAKWEEGAPARAVEWEKGAPQRRAAEEVARLKAEIARVEQEEVDRLAALAKEKQENLRKQREKEEEERRKAELTSLERDAAALREKLAAMKELMAMKVADPESYAAADAARAAFVTRCPPPLPQYADGGGPGVCRPPEAETRSLQALRAPIQGVSVSYAVIHFAEKAGISKEEAEAVLAFLKPADGHRANMLLAEQTFARFAKSKGITVTGAIVTMREWANGRE